MTERRVIQGRPSMIEFDKVQQPTDIRTYYPKEVDVDTERQAALYGGICS